jgi:hypothetical protein
LKCLKGDLDADPAAVFEAISNRLGDAVNANRNAINSCVDDTLSERIATEANEAQGVTIHNGSSRFAVDRHPDRTSIGRQQAMEHQGRFKRDDAGRYALAGEYHPMLKT